MLKKDCLFCRIINGEVPSSKVYENEYVYAFLDIFPNSDGHTLVIPKSHSDYFSDTEDLYLAEVAKASKLIANRIYDTLKPKGINYIINEKEEAFQQVFHYHMHVIPKYHRQEGYNFNINPNDDLTSLDEIKNKIAIK
ncbi:MULTISPECIES: HIT family protein [Spiroplasma]|uniref:Histidine triad protein n=1 Tax=Spiroplasma eriocheiris TaxID=315358 RepID=A0A0H3XLB3_9MOLU|nr:HIT family protein [Spiroplasma eriocheiris]AHF58279.1 putative nucleotidyl hydrolase/transferase [Spiroplasma eriocheiris CCTCC M 207170]AKM54716.1 histidine triad protein [Spiroplasma eriocheiris]